MRILPIALLLAGAAPICLHAQTAANTPVTGMQNFIHSVANLEKSAAFYRNVFGLELNGLVSSQGHESERSARGFRGSRTNRQSQWRPQRFRAGS